MARLHGDANAFCRRHSRSKLSHYRVWWLASCTSTRTRLWFPEITTTNCHKKPLTTLPFIKSGREACLLRPKCISPQLCHVAATSVECRMEEGKHQVFWISTKISCNYGQGRPLRFGVCGIIFNKCTASAPATWLPLIMTRSDPSHLTPFQFPLAANSTNSKCAEQMHVMGQLAPWLGYNVEVSGLTLPFNAGVYVSVLICFLRILSVAPLYEFHIFMASWKGANS